MYLMGAKIGNKNNEESEWKIVTKSGKNIRR